uniref:G_PROTEIN_RECEP_F2_4 domain-containing protein n=1 Tax=Panagrellus redivivus TaxID=6233 RepID=A0A7E4W4F7_PANRE
MFYACLSIMILIGIMFFCVTIAIIDLETYNFGLYIVLLCIVGTMLACALCIANPNACANPSWYTKFCFMLQEMYPVNDGTASPKMNGLRSRMMAMQQQQSAAAAASTNGGQSTDSKLILRNESRATVAMLAPAVHIMHQVWKGMAWVADGIEEEEVTRSYDVIEQGISTTESQSDHGVKGKLSTIVESSCSIAGGDEISSDFTSGHDVMV